MKNLIFNILLLVISSCFGVACLLFAAVATSWVEYDFFHIDPHVTSLLPLAFVPLFIVLSCGTFCAGFFGVKYAAALTCKYIKIWRCKLI